MKFWTRACVVFSTLIGIFAAGAAGAQQTVIVGGVVISATSGEVLPYSTVSIVGGAQRFTAADGSFSFALSPGQYSFRVRQLGYAPLDTLIPVNPGANLRSLKFALNPAAYRLDIVRTYANSCSGANAADLGGILDELVKNAERERILRTSYPFIYDFEHSVELKRNGVTRDSAVDTLRFASRTLPPYSPGNLVQAADTNAKRGSKELRLPTLIDLADPVFVASHCFRFRGVERVSDTATYRIDFKPTDDVKGPDVEGSIFLDSASYLIKRAVFRLTKPTRVVPPVIGVEVTTTYYEIFKGLSLFGNIHSVQPLSRSFGFRSEMWQDEKLIAVRFYGPTPGDVVLTESPVANPPRPVIDSSATLSGFVVDSGGRPLLGAQIIVADGNQRAVSGDSGQFVLKGLKPGKTDVVVRVLGYGPATFSTVLRAARTRRIRVILTPVSVQLSAIVVRDSISDPLLARTGFYARRKTAAGTFITPEEIERRSASSVSDLLRMVPGLSVQPASRNGTGSLPWSKRGGGMRPCLMELFIDGVRAEIGGSGGAVITLEDAISETEVGAIEVYPGPADTPPQFSGVANACGSIVIWTKGWLSDESAPDSTKHE